MHPLLALNPHEARTVAALFERMFPADEAGPGAGEIGALEYLDRALAGAYREQLERYRLGLAALDRAAQTTGGAAFAECDHEVQVALISALERGELPEFRAPPAGEFFELVRAHLQEGLFADPAYGGNRDKLGWRVLGHPGVWLENSAEENLMAAPADKGGRIQSLADLGLLIHEGHEGHEGLTTLEPTSGGERPALEPITGGEKPSDLRVLRVLRGSTVSGYDPQRGTLPPTGPCDVLLVGLGGMGAFVAPLLARAGLQVVALEAGPWRSEHDFIPDELGHSYACRAVMGPKFTSETPRWRRNAGEPTQEATFSLGRMMNSVGGSIIHYGAWLRRFYPHHFRQRSMVQERWGAGVLPEQCTLADWPVSYADLEPYYEAVEQLVGVAGDAASNPFLARGPFPMPPLRPFRHGEIFRAAAETLGLHPFPVPVGLNSVAYGGRPATSYSGWNNGFGSRSGAKWHPDMLLPEALASGNLDIRTHCRALRILTDSDGHASGVEYVDANGALHTQAARTVILCSYTFENVRLLLLSGDGRHPNGLGNNSGQVGQHFMTKMFAHVDGDFPHLVFNRHTGPAAQSLVLDDFLEPGFDSWQHGFVGGATLSAEQQFLPIQISREALPPDVPRWGSDYKAHIRRWQHLGVVRIQPDTLSYRTNFLDLDPHVRDRSGLGLPVVRITCDMRPNEQRLADWMEGKSEQILHAMGATKTWRGARFTGVGSSHDLGGCRMGEDPQGAVVNADLRVHDTPGLYVFGGAAFPSCPGINPTLTAWALCWRATDALVARLRA